MDRSLRQSQASSSWLSYNWRGFQAWDTRQDTTDNSSICKVETSLEWQKYFSQFQDIIYAFPCHIHLPVCMWIMDPHSKAPKKNTSMGMRCYRKILRISYKDHATNEEVRAKIQQAIRPHEDLLTIIERHKLQCNGMVMSPIHQVWLKQSCNAQCKGEEDKADGGRGGKTASGNGQAWSSAGPREQCRTGKNGENWLQNHMWCPYDPRS